MFLILLTDNVLVKQKQFWGTLWCKKWFGCGHLEEWRSGTFGEGVLNALMVRGTPTPKSKKIA